MKDSQIEKLSNQIEEEKTKYSEIHVLLLKKVNYINNLIYPNIGKGIIFKISKFRKKIIGRGNIKIVIIFLYLVITIFRKSKCSELQFTNESLQNKLREKKVSESNQLKLALKEQSIQ